MPRPGFGLTIMQFQERFAYQEACRACLFASRWPDGFCCRRCGGGEMGVRRRRRLVWQCAGCGAQASVAAGTVMQGTRQPLRLWFFGGLPGGHPPTRGFRPSSCSASLASPATRRRG